MSKAFDISHTNFIAASDAVVSSGPFDDGNPPSSNICKIDWSDVNQYRLLQNELLTHLSVALSGKTKTWDIARVSLGSVEQIFAHMGRNFLVEVKRHEREHRMAVTARPMPAVASLCEALHDFGCLSQNAQGFGEKTQQFRGVLELWSEMKRKASAQITGERNQTAANFLTDHLAEKFSCVWFEKSLGQTRTLMSGSPAMVAFVPR